MLYRLLADVVVILHLTFVLFVLFGGLLALWRPCTVWLHLPAAAWGAAVEFGGWICPLTPLEQGLRLKGSAPVYGSNFIEAYVLPVLYPSWLTYDLQIMLGTLVVVINLAIYGCMWRSPIHGKVSHGGIERQKRASLCRQSKHP
ncbi:MAG: DUF2784 domain-containing protein [Nitrospiraceae bacterium]|nr:DUF2784 domain-containing protein [Nitrospiraceae bacterium]